jgi:Uma2 family endonuclease
LNDWSEPEPDLAVCVLEPHRYTRAHPLPEQIALICEIASSSLAYDRTEKAAAYAASGIPEYWIVDVDRRAIHVLRQPDRDERRYRLDETIDESGHLVAPGGARIASADVLPPR